MSRKAAAVPGLKNTRGLVCSFPFASVRGCRGNIIYIQTSNGMRWRRRAVALLHFALSARVRAIYVDGTIEIATREILLRSGELHEDFVNVIIRNSC